VLSKLNPNSQAPATTLQAHGIHSPAAGGWQRQESELTLGIGADKGGKVGKQGEGGEVSQVSDLQGVQEGAEALGTEPRERR
jgi:hypothetical protein